jgi:hypothetical protein
MEKIMEQVQQWEYLSSLAKENYGFLLRMELREQELQYRIFSYINEKQHKCFSVLYDSATKEFMVRITVGLTEYCDITFITPDLPSLESLLQERMAQRLAGMAAFDRASMDSILLDKKVLEWDCGNRLPENCCGFSLFINPREPVKVINGSYIIIDYSDFLKESNLIIYYNMFRDEFFGELRLKRTPAMTAAFDCRTVDELATRIEENLQPVLKSIREQIDGDADF